jgi:hypothetical protein
MASGFSTCRSVNARTCSSYGADLPAGHDVHDEDLSRATFPDAHAVQLAAPAAEKVMELHVSHFFAPAAE